MASTKQIKDLPAHGVPDGSEKVPVQLSSGTTAFTTVQQFIDALGIEGDKGDAGEDGRTWLTSDGVPSDGNGVDGDLNFDYTNDDIYVKSGGSWGSPVANLKGETGEQGVQGVQGPAGEDGSMTGPDTSTDNAVPRFDGTDGTTVQNSSVTIDDSGNISVPGTVDGRDVAADGSKLDGIEDSADVTDVADAINSATGKTTPVDADVTGIVDSAASNVLKKLTWANLKATLKTYFDTLYVASTGQTLSSGFLTDSYARGTVSSGIETPAPASAQENIQHYTNNGAHTLDPPANPCTVIIEITNGASAGAITTSGFSQVTGDSFTTTVNDDFLCFITKTQNFSLLNIIALQ